MNLVSLRVLIRGGITFGEVSARVGRAFGPAFVDAYGLESRFAHFPRIVVSPSALNATLDVNTAFYVAQDIVAAPTIVTTCEIFSDAEMMGCGLHRTILSCR
jgi:hypothetical protein